MKHLIPFLALLLICALLAPGQQPMSDDRIYDEVRRKLTNDPDVKGGTLEYEVKDGVVTLRGQVDRAKAISKAEKLAKKVKGVKGVINQLTVKTT